MSNPVLRWKDPTGADQRHEFVAEQILIGRKSDSDIVLSNPYVSRHHAKIVRDDEIAVIVDLGSTHGTYLNGRRIEREPLQDGDRIGVGRDQSEITFWTGEPGSTEVPNKAFETAFLNLTAIMPGESAAAPSELEKLSVLLDFQFQWGRQFSADGMFLQVLQSALQISGAERGFILRREGKQFEFALGLDAGLNKLSEAEFQTSRSVVKQVSTEAEPVFMTEGISGELAQQESIVAMNLRAVACLPLRGIASGDSPEVLGILYLDSTKTMHALTGLDQKILNKLASEAGNVLEKLNTIRHTEERNKMERELALAQEAQVNLLPRTIPEFEGFVIRSFSRPTRYVGGDFYDFIKVKENLVGILADVSGKGVSASLLSSSLQGALHMLFHVGEEPQTILTNLNKFVFERSESNRFVTLFLFILDPRGEGIFISAGHNPAYLFRSDSGQVDSLASSDLILGAFAFTSYDTNPLRLDPGDILVVYSDGLTDAENPEEEMFGEENLIQLIQRHGREGAATLEQKIFEELDAFTKGVDQTDDITFMVVERSR